MLDLTKENHSFTIDLAPAAAKLVIDVTHDGPISNFGKDDTRPDTMIQISYVVEDYGVYYKTPKQSAVPFLGHGDSTDSFLRDIGWKASMWQGEYLTSETRSNLLASIESILKQRGHRFWPSTAVDYIDQPYGSFVEFNKFFHLEEHKHDQYSVWLKRSISKDNKITSRWSFVKTEKAPVLPFITEDKVAFTDTTKWDESPMSFKEAVEHFEGHRYSQYLNLSTKYSDE